MTPIVFTLVETTEPLAENISQTVRGIHQPITGDVVKTLASAFVQGRPIIAIMASGIIMRAIAPHMADKHADAPVIAVSADGQHIVPLIGGHHGANKLAARIAEATGGTAAITTASDTQFNVSLDEPPAGYTLANPQDFKPFMAKLLAGSSIVLNGSAQWLENSNLPFSTGASMQISITDSNLSGSPEHLVYTPKILCVGIGCERGTDAAEVESLISQCLQQASLSKNAIASINSIDLKADEAAINQAAASLNVPVRFFTADELNQQADRLQNPSQVVMAEVGCPGVAEGAALAACGNDGELIVAKTKSLRATCAIARKSEPLTELAGRSRGRLSIIGIGPGSDEWRSPQATDELINASDWVGYGLYLDLASQLKTSQTEHRFDLGKEEARVRHAFALAGQGRNVALVCSGDAAIYAMAALVYEVLDSQTLTPPEQRVEIVTVPGISAFQAASARAGALIGHDFCTISLSDLLTPWATIEQRLHAAARGDFNIAFYNPRSLKRTDQLQKAIDILTPHRTPDTPVIIASNLGRPTEKVTTVAFKDFNPQLVDMLTIVLIGSSQSKIISRGDGVNYCYTPRGYANKTSVASKANVTSKVNQS